MRVTSFSNKIMDVIFFLIGILSTSLSLLFLVITYKKHKPDSHQKLPPGSKGWPAIGETMDFVSSGREGNPEKFINERMKKHSPQVFKTSLAGENMAVFCGASGNKFLFSNENKLVVSWWPPTVEKILISGDATTIAETKKTRGYLPEFLKPEALQQYVETMDLMSRRHVEREWVPNKEVKVLPLSRKLTFALSCKLFMSLEDPIFVDNISNHFSLVMAGIMSVPINFPGTAFNKAIKAANCFRADILPVIKERRRMVSASEDVGKKQDLLSCMLLVTDEDGDLMSDMEIIDKILGLLLASHDTTSTVITFVVFYLADHPNVYDQVFREQMEIAKSKGGEEELLSWEDIQKMKYSRSVVNEAMRLAPPSQGAFKEAITDFSYAGFTIPKGWKAHWSVYSTHKDPKYFPDPDKFDPSRFEGSGPTPFTFVPFGGGPRMCPGSEFARTEILIFLHSLITKFRWEKAIPQEKVVFNPTPLPVHGLPIKLLPRGI